ncbi:hypothetical protein BDC45DRAFT_545943 [Circinella umbellata]|nr:hypothetical protein BDC45DRAFT_545943 [Circinella umbellata]
MYSTATNPMMSYYPTTQFQNDFTQGRYTYNDVPYPRQQKPTTTDVEIPTTRRKSCTRSFCCPCCMCFPYWMRCICCFFLLLFMAAAGLTAFVATQFKVPSVDFYGLTDHPSGLPKYNKTNETTFDINVGLRIGVVNPNMAGVSFEKIEATAYYPTAPTRSIGGGELNNLVINSHGTTNFTFPFHVEFDASKDEEQNMLLDISQRCGLTGGEQKDLVVNYMLTPTIRIIGFPISAVIKDTVQVPCPPLGM